MQQIKQPFVQIADLSGIPLEGGSLYFGTPNLNPETNPVSVYWDAAGTQPCAQPIKTAAGYPVRNGKIADIYAPNNYSLTAKDKNGKLLFYKASIDNDAALISTSAAPGNAWTTVQGFIGYLISSAGSSVLGFVQAGANAIARTLQDKAREVVSITDFVGCDPTGASSSTAAVQAAITKLGSYGTITLPAGTFAFNADVGSARINFKGAGLGKTIIKSYTAGGAAIVYAANTSWDFVFVEDMTITGDAGTVTKIGVQFGHGIYATNDEFAGRAVFNRVKFFDLDKCVARLYGNIGVYFTHCYFSNANYHLWSKGQSSPLMHAGCSFAKLCHFDSAALAVCYVDSPQVGTGQFITEDCIIEANPGFVFFIKNFNDTAIGEGFIVRASWNEANSTAGSVTIDGVAYTPKHIYAANVPHLRVEDTTMGPVQLVNSRLSTLNCQLDFMTLTNDIYSTCFHDDAVMDSCRRYTGMVRTIKMMKRPAGNFASWAKIPHHRIQAKAAPLALLYSQYFAAPISFTGTVARNSTNATEGVLYNQSVVQDLVINPGENLFPSGSSFNISASKFYAWFFTYRNLTGGGVQPVLSITYNTTLVSSVMSLSIPGQK